MSADGSLNFCTMTVVEEEKKKTKNPTPHRRKSCLGCLLCNNSFVVVFIHTLIRKLNI